MDTPGIPIPTAAAVHGPYEDLGIAAFAVLEKLIDGQTADQKAKLWQNWMDFWQPIMSLMIVKKP